MTEKPKITTSNGYEIENPVDKLTANQFREVMSDEFGINGDNPKARMEQFKNLSIEGVAILLERINKGLQGSEDSLMNHDRAMKIGDTETIKP